MHTRSGEAAHRSVMALILKFCCDPDSAPDETAAVVSVWS